MTVQNRWATLRADRLQEGGYVAVMTGLLLMVLMGLAAFAVDVGQWYVVGQQEQRAADAAALAGVTKLPGDLAGAQATARDFSRINRFENLPGAATNPTTVTAGLDGGKPTRLRVTVTRTVDNIFGPLLGIAKTTITRTAVADFGGPIPMGSPCNGFGDDPDAGSNRGSTCAGVNGKLWTSISGKNALKQNGDAFQADRCSSSSPAESCPGTGLNNSEYDANGYFYTVSVKQYMPSLTIELFDPAWVNVGPDCDDVSFGTSTTEARDALNDYVTDEALRYVSGDTKWCTGDRLYSGTTVMNTSFTVRAPSATPWNPLSGPEETSCIHTYAGFRSTSNQGLYKALNKASVGYRDDIAQSFRRWTVLCTIPSPTIGDYLIQVKTNDIGSDTADAANRFSMRAYSAGDSSAKDSITLVGRERMAIYVNATGATAEFYLARIPSAAAGQALRVRLFDIGDSTDPGNIQILKPPDADGDDFSNCQTIVPTKNTWPTCQFPVTTTTYNGKWETLTIPIPANYHCDDLVPTECWVRLKYPYGSSANPHDQTTWTAGLDGDPVRLVE